MCKETETLSEYQRLFSANMAEHMHRRALFYYSNCKQIDNQESLSKADDES